MTLEDFTRYLGVAVAPVGAFVVSPQGAALFLKRSASPLGRVRQALARWVPWFRRSVTLQMSTAMGVGVAMSGRAHVRPGWPTKPTVATLAAATHEWLTALDRELAQVWSAVDTERADRKRALEAAHASFSESVHALRGRMQQAEQAALELDSRAVPVVGLGVVLGSMPEQLASWPLWVYVPVVLSAVWFTVSSAWHAVRYRRHLAGT